MAVGSLQNTEATEPANIALVPILFHFLWQCEKYQNPTYTLNVARKNNLPWNQVGLSCSTTRTWDSGWPNTWRLEVRASCWAGAKAQESRGGHQSSSFNHHLTRLKSPPVFSDFGHSDSVLSAGSGAHQNYLRSSRVGLYCIVCHCWWLWFGISSGVVK